MLNKLFSSRTKAEILKLVLFNPDTSFYQRQISQLIGQSLRGVQRELSRFQEIGLVQGSRQGNRIYYRVNKKCPIFEDLRNIFLKTAGIAEVLKDNLSKKDIRIAFIYGSYAKGRENFLSDLDLMVIGNISSKVLSSLLSEPKRKLMREINYAVFSPQEVVKRKKAKDHFIESILRGRKVFILGDENKLKALVKSK